MVKQSFLILGREPSLSFAEIYQFLEDDKKIFSFSQEAILVADQELGQTAPVLLGGVVKSGSIVATEHCSVATTNSLVEYLAKILEKYIQPGQKFHFGLSFYNFGKSAAFDKQKLGLNLKKILRVKGHSVRFVESRNENLSAVDVVKNKLLDKGIEICLFQSAGRIYAGRTRAVQPYEEYSDRDYGRPARDAKRGMLPPKLARTIVNLAKVEPGGLIVDPFAGVGTVLQEALLMGYKVVGTDIDKKAIYASKQNLEWLLGHYRKDLPDYKLEKMDVRQIDKILASQSADAIVTEFDLGPPLSGNESQGGINRQERLLSDFYIQSLELLHDILKNGRRAVIAWTYFARQNLFISAFRKLSDLGWEAVEPFPKKYQDVFRLSSRGTLLYGRDGQHVWREILILKKK